MTRALSRLAVVASLGTSLGAAALLTGCSVFVEEPDEPTVVETEEPAEVDEVLGALDPLLGDEESLPSSAQVFETLTEAGYSEEQLEATQDDTPLQSGVPSKQFAVKVDAGCVVGEIREGRAMARLMPPSESTDTCMFGAVDRPEGAPEPSGDPWEDGAEDNGAGHIPGESFSREDDDSEDPSGTGSDPEPTADPDDSGDSGSGSAGLGGN